MRGAQAKVLGNHRVVRYGPSGSNVSPRALCWSPEDVTILGGKWCKSVWGSAFFVPDPWPKDCGRRESGSCNTLGL